MTKPKIFNVTRTPKATDNIVTVKPDIISQYYSAVINVSDSECATFDYQRAGIPSFWFPINEVEHWGHAPFLGVLRVVNEYYKGDKPILIHCHAGANRSPSIAYAILLTKGYSVQEAEESLNYTNISKVFEANMERKQIPYNILNFLKEAEKDSSLSVKHILMRLDNQYNDFADKWIKNQMNYTLGRSNDGDTKLVYDDQKKRFIFVKPEWKDPEFKSKEWYTTPLVNPENWKSDKL